MAQYNLEHPHNTTIDQQVVDILTEHGYKDTSWDQDECASFGFDSDHDIPYLVYIVEPRDDSPDDYTETMLEFYVDNILQSICIESDLQGIKDTCDAIVNGMTLNVKK